MMLYLDMDGVIADFFGGLEKKYGVDHWKNLPDKEESIFNLKYTDFFNTLELYPTSNELVLFCKNLAKNNFGICSSPLTDDEHNSAYWKRIWLERHGFMPKVSNCIFTRQKQKYAVGRIDGSPNILVDDKPSNIDHWNKCGGIGIRYQANEDSLQDLKMKLQAVYKD